MLKTDHRPFKAAMHELIDELAEQITMTSKNPTIDEVTNKITDLIKEHRISLTAPEFAAHIWKLLMAHNGSRAHQLVNKGVEDWGYSWTAAIVLGLGKHLGITMLKLAALAAYIILVIVTWERLQ